MSLRGGRVRVDCRYGGTFAGRLALAASKEWLRKGSALWKKGRSEALTRYCTPTRQMAVVLQNNRERRGSYHPVRELSDAGHRGLQFKRDGRMVKNVWTGFE